MNPATQVVVGREDQEDVASFRIGWMPQFHAIVTFGDGVGSVYILGNTLWLSEMDYTSRCAMAIVLGVVVVELSCLSTKCPSRYSIKDRDAGTRGGAPRLATRCSKKEREENSLQMNIHCA
jgi:hypothetical protein